MFKELFRRSRLFSLHNCRFCFARAKTEPPPLSPVHLKGVWLRDRGHVHPQHVDPVSCALPLQLRHPGQDMSGPCWGKVRVCMHRCFEDFSPFPPWLPPTCMSVSQASVCLLCPSGCIVPSLPRDLGQVGTSSGEKPFSYNSLLW